MSTFTDYANGVYTYDNGKIHNIPSKMLETLFETNGYCVDPCSKNGDRLSNFCIDTLHKIATENSDFCLLNSLNKFKNKCLTCPANILREITLTEISKFNNSSKDELLELLETILDVAFYILGWEGTFLSLTKRQKDYDIVRIELKISPMLKNISEHFLYPEIKNFPIINYIKYNNDNFFTPCIADIDIDYCINQISSGSVEIYDSCALNLITTIFYYLNNIAKIPLPIEDVILQLLY